ncbi:MAG: hypothetical protein IJH38_08240 [Clostridia bacterium]|nr:hypothetical protein [Clostridia bacterium]
MTLDIIAILLSFAMMLTGVGGEGQPAQASRNLVVRNVSLTYNGETVPVGPAVRFGVDTDGSRALFDFDVDLDGQKLMPVQLGVDKDGLTALLGNSDVAVKVTARALEGLGERLGEMTEDATGEDQALMQYISDEFLPAYTALLKAATDGDFMRQAEPLGREAYDRVVDRGEGVPSTFEALGETYEGTAYDYALDSEALAELCDAMYTAVPVMEDYYNALFGLYARLPEESGLRDIHSFRDLFEKTGVDVHLDVTEQIADEGKVNRMETVVTADMNAAIARMSAYETEGGEDEIQDADAPEEAETEDAEAGDDGDTGIEPEGDAEDPLEPFIWNVTSVRVGDNAESHMDFEYETPDGKGWHVDGAATQAEGTTDVEMNFRFSEDGSVTHRMQAGLYMAGDGQDGSSYSVNVKGIAQDTARVEASAFGLCYPDGTSENSCYFGIRTEEHNVSLAFDADVTADPVQDRVSGHDVTISVDDLSEEGLQALTSDSAVAVAAARVAASFSGDAKKLGDDSGVKKTLELIRTGRLPIDVSEMDEAPYDYSYDMELAEGDDSGIALEGLDEGMAPDMEEEPKDDGVLGFAQPGLDWLPQGWTVASTDVDTAYDWVEMVINDENGAEAAYAVFFADPDEEVVNYIVKEDGSMVDGRQVNVTDFGEGGLSVTVRESGIYGNIMFMSEAIDVDVIGRIVAGIRF